MKPIWKFYNSQRTSWDLVRIHVLSWYLFGGRSFRNGNAGGGTSGKSSFWDRSNPGTSNNKLVQKIQIWISCLPVLTTVDLYVVLLFFHYPKVFNDQFFNFLEDFSKLSYFLLSLKNQTYTLSFTVKSCVGLK